MLRAKDTRRTGSYTVGHFELLVGRHVTITTAAGTVAGQVTAFGERPGPTPQTSPYQVTVIALDGTVTVIGAKHVTGVTFT
jgi:hypothetical protein